MTVNEPAIQVAHLSKSFDRVKAVQDLSFEIRKGEIFGLLGPNGAGKTTTLNMMEGLLKADRGQVTILGMDLEDHTREIKRRIGVQLQSTSLLPDLTVFEQIQLFAMGLAGTAFVAFGSLIGSFCRKTDLAGYLFFFTIMPLTFLANFPAKMLPESINVITPWLPISMAIELIGPVFVSGQLSSQSLSASLGLATFAVIFALAARIKSSRQIS